MRFEFTAKTNKPYYMINKAYFKIPSGTIWAIDRKEDNYDISDDGTLTAEWRGVYLWEVEGKDIFEDEDEALKETNYLSDAIIDALQRSQFLYLELEDDADDDYEVTDVDWCVE